MSLAKAMKTTMLLAIFTLLLNFAIATEENYSRGQETRGHSDSTHEYGSDCKKAGHNHGWGSYKFGYGVEDKHTGDYKTHTEVRQGGWTKGSYSVVQPDGILRTVVYEAAPGKGFKAVVYNHGWAKKASNDHKKKEEKYEGWSH